MKITFKALSLALIVCLFAGCAHMPRGHSLLNQRLPLPTHQYLALANTNTGMKRQDYLLKAAQRALQDRDTVQARQTLTLVDRNLTGSLQARKELLDAELNLTLRNTNRAVSQLQNLQPTVVALNRIDQIRFHQLFARAYRQQGNIPNYIEQNDRLFSLLPNTATRRELAQKVWEQLQHYNPQQLSNILSQTEDPTTRGWLDFTLITEQTSADNTNLSQRLSAWQTQYQNHPAQVLIPSNLGRWEGIEERPRQIALLLPITGRYAKPANAIRNGFFAAYYQNKTRQQYNPKIVVYDTNNNNVNEVYQRAVSEGAKFVVGPLTKENVRLIAHSRLSVPTLALNTLPGDDSSSNLYQFGLSPDDEIKQIAQRMWDDHRIRIAIIVPKSAYGERLKREFLAQWDRLGGQVIATMEYPPASQDLEKDVRQLLRVDIALKQKKALRRMLHQDIRYIPRRRQDIDGIFLVSTPSKARLIRPLLRFYFADNLPVYATSKVFPGIPNAHRDRDLDGIIFPDIPWVVQTNRMTMQQRQVRQSILTLWPKSFNRFPKLYALGVDAYDIIPKLNRMSILPQFGTRAATGTLYLTGRHELFRKLSWSKMVNGTPRTL